MKKEPREILIDYIEKKVAKEKDKFMSGVKSDYYEWEDFLEWFKSIIIRDAVNEGELTRMRDYLKEKQLSREYDQWVKMYYLKR